MKTFAFMAILAVLAAPGPVCHAETPASPFVPGLADYRGDNEPAQLPTRSFQLSFVPFIGTDGTFATENLYNFSLNLLGGVTGGVDGIELGGFLNVNLHSMTGLQAAGFVNVVNGRAKGLQMSGFVNVNNGFTEGLQGAGFGNIVNGNTRALQGSGFGNIVTGNMEGIQATGFGNIVAGNSKGIQLAGFGNVTGGNSASIQASGFGNITGGSLTGIQASGFGNITGERMSGIQAAGFGNIATEVEGIQVAGFLNVARRVNGLQLGFVNIADTVDGLPIGFLSIVRRGYRKLELTAGDAMNLSAGFKIGVRRFYNIFSLGTQTTGGDWLFAWGYGIGSEFNLPDNRNLNVEILTHRFMEEEWWRHSRLNMLNQARVTYARPLSERWQIFAGPAINFHMIRDVENAGKPADIAPYELFSFRVRDTNTRVWLGINAGLRFW
jgi:hypothetical protein